MNDAPARSSGTPADQQASGVDPNGGTPTASPEQPPVEPTGPHAVDPAAKYSFNEGANRFELSGLDVQNMIGKGAQARQLQGERDRATARNRTLETQTVDLQTQLAEAQQTIAQTQQREQVTELVKEHIPASRQSPPASEDPWSTGDDPPQLNPDQIAQTISDVTKEAVEQATQQNLGNIEELVTNIVAGVMQKQTAQRELQNNAQQWSSDVFNQQVSEYEALGFDRSGAEAIAKMNSTAALYEARGRELAGQGNGQEAANQYDAYSTLTKQANQKIVEQMAKQQAEEELAEFESQVEGGQSFIATELPEGVDLSQVGGPLWKDPKALRKLLKDKASSAASGLTKINMATNQLAAAREKLNTPG